MALASSTYLVINMFRRLIGLNDHVKVTRQDINWNLDLREGIDLSIYLIGSFQKKVAETCTRLLPSNGIALDIGANMGSVTIPLSQSVIDAGKVIAIEPTQYPFERLKKNIAANVMSVNVVEALQLFLTNNKDEAPPNYLQSSWKLSGNRENVHPIHLGAPQATIGASSMTLDELIANKGLKRLDVIKIDVDGAEDDILASGMKSILQFKPAIVIEVAPYTLIERQLHPLAPLLRLKDLGYKFSTMDGRLLSEAEWMNLTLLKPGQSKDIVAMHESKIDLLLQRLL